MKKCKRCNLAKEESEFYKKTRTKDGLTSDCKECIKKAISIYRNNNRERIRETNRRSRRKHWPHVYAGYRKWWSEHKEIHQAYQAKSYRKHRHKRLAECKLYRLNNPESKETVRIRKSKWMEKNRHKHCAIQATRTAKKLNATPRWLSDDHKNEIRAMYRKASEQEQAIGIKHGVDHIIPLKHPLVCGLHVPWNLQVLTKSENSKKGNRIDLQSVVT